MSKSRSGDRVSQLRAFVAVEIDDKTRQRVAAWQEELRQSGGDVKWVEPVNFHLTLKFLGNVETVRVPALSSALKASLAGHRAFSVELAGMGAFPSIARPRVIWVGLSEGAGELRLLAQAVDKALEPLGFPREEKPFAPHLTIGRVRDRGIRRGVPDELKRSLASSSTVKWGSFLVDSVHLMKSQLTARGPIYSRVEVMQLAR